jgi:hypothetical protein
VNDFVVARTSTDSLLIGGEPSSFSTPKKRRRLVNPVPFTERLLLEIPDAAKLASVSVRTMKRVAQQHPELTALLNRRRLFVRAKLEQWLLEGGNESHARRRGRR